MLLSGETGKRSRENEMAGAKRQSSNIASCGSYPCEPKENDEGMLGQSHRTEKMQKPDNTQCWEGCELLPHIWLQPIWKALWKYLEKLKLYIPGAELENLHFQPVPRRCSC